MAMIEYGHVTSVATKLNDLTTSLPRRDAAAHFLSVSPKAVTRNIDRLLLWHGAALRNFIHIEVRPVLELRPMKLNTADHNLLGE
jgi:hypothetical protein